MKCVIRGKVSLGNKTYFCLPSDKTNLVHFLVDNLLPSDTLSERDSWCLCCMSFIRNLTLTTCSKENCTRKRVYPKLVEECPDCLKTCSATRRCNQLVNALPRCWYETPQEKAVKFDFVEGRIVISTTTDRHIYLYRGPVGKSTRF